MAESPPIGDLLNELAREVEESGWSRVDEIAGALAKRAHELKAEVGRVALERLRLALRFPAMQTLASSMIQAGTADLSVRFEHVVAVLGQGDVTAAVALLNDIGERVLPVGIDRISLLNLQGQTYKRAALATHDPAQAGRLLSKSIRHYHEASKTATSLGNDQAWLANRSNVVALLARAGRKRLALEGVRADQVQALAGELLERARLDHARGTSTTADFAAAIEANIALADYDEAARWASRLASGGPRLGFEINATLRQLVDVWELREDSAGGQLVLPLLQAALLGREKGHVVVEAKSVATNVDTQAQLERVFGNERYKPLAWFMNGLQRCRAIARIERQAGQAHGSGILVPGDRLHPGLANQWLLMTNAHVLCSREDPQPGALWPDEARATFHGLAGEDQGPFRVSRIVWSSPIHGLDTTLAALERAPATVPAYDLSERPPALDQSSRIYAIGHPLGGDLSLSLDDNHLLGFQPPRIHYRTPTEKGSSGSPLFDDQWNLIGLHHAGSDNMRRLDGSGFYQANEGFWIKSIREALAGHLEN